MLFCIFFHVFFLYVKSHSSLAWCVRGQLTYNNIILFSENFVYANDGSWSYPPQSSFPVSISCLVFLFFLFFLIFLFPFLSSWVQLGLPICTGYDHWNMSSLPGATPFMKTDSYQHLQRQQLFSSGWGFVSTPSAYSMPGHWLLWSCHIWSRQPQLLRVHGSSSPAVSRRHLFAAVLPDFGLSQSFCSGVCDVPWALTQVE